MVFCARVSIDHNVGAQLGGVGLKEALSARAAAVLYGQVVVHAVLCRRIHFSVSIFTDYILRDRLYQHIQKGKLRTRIRTELGSPRQTCS